MTVCNMTAKFCSIKIVACQVSEGSTVRGISIYTKTGL